MVDVRVLGRASREEGRYSAAHRRLVHRQLTDPPSQPGVEECLCENKAAMSAGQDGAAGMTTRNGLETIPSGCPEDAQRMPRGCP
jgi:hypothetical protein